MARKHSSARRAAVFAWILFLECLPGCVSPPGKRPEPTQDPAAQPGTPAPAQPTDATPPATLEAIEEFLQRTAEYKLPEPVPPPVPPARPVVAKAGAAPAKAVIGEGQKPSAATSNTVPPREQVFVNTQVQLPEPVPPAPPAVPVIRSVSIRSAATVGSTSVVPARTNATNEPLDLRSGEDPTWPVHRLVSSLKERADEVGDFESVWRLRLVQLALDQDDGTPPVAEHLPEDARSMLMALIQTVREVRNLGRDASMTGQETLRTIDELRQAVADRADPIITHVALCRKVVTFGVYEALDVDEFVAGRGIHTIVYSEIRNFRSEFTGEGDYRTRLATRLEVLTAGGQSVWQRTEPEIVDRCRERRTDFFIAQRIMLPATLEAGDYVLKILVEDALSGRADEATYAFKMLSPSAIAVGG